MMMKKFSLLLIFASFACSSAVPETPAEFSDPHFQSLVLEISESPGYFDTDNLISNESSYLHVVPRLREVTQAGGVYLGVGPDQNFSYIVATQPALAFMIDIRRDNLLQHLYFKTLFESSSNRWEFLARLFGKPLPPGMQGSPASSGAELVEAFRTLESDRDYWEEILTASWDTLRQRFPEIIEAGDQSQITNISRSFFLENVDLKFRSHGRSPRAFYPTFGELITSTDLSGREQNYLASESGYQVIRKLQLENRIIPIVGNLAGDHALSRIAEFLQGRKLTVSAFYVSNVEFYLFQNSSFRRFLKNLKQLPSNEHSFLIRSYFGYWRRPHPETVPGHAVTQLLQPFSSLFRVYSENPFLGYRDLVFRHYEPLQREAQGIH